MKVIELQSLLTRHELSNSFTDYLSAPQVRLDLANVEQADTAGLAWLIRLVTLAKQQNIEIELINMPEQMIKLAKISHVVTMLPIVNQHS